MGPCISKSFKKPFLSQITFHVPQTSLEFYIQWSSEKYGLGFLKFVFPSFNDFFLDIVSDRKPKGAFIPKMGHLIAKQGGICVWG